MAIPLHLQRTQAGVVVNVHPVVPLVVCDAYIRRTGHTRVLGTILGSVSENTYHVTSCFVVPHTETNSQVTKRDAEVVSLRKRFVFRCRLTQATIRLYWNCISKSIPKILFLDGAYQRHRYAIHARSCRLGSHRIIRSKNWTVSFKTTMQITSPIR